MTISSHIFEAYLHCATKCWLLSRGEAGLNNKYTEWMREKNQAYRVDATLRISSNRQKDDYVAAPSVAVNFKSVLWKFASDVTVSIKELESCKQTSGKFTTPSHQIVSHFSSVIVAKIVTWQKLPVKMTVLSVCYDIIHTIRFSSSNRLSASSGVRVAMLSFFSRWRS